MWRKNPIYPWSPLKSGPPSRASSRASFTVLSPAALSPFPESAVEGIARAASLNLIPDDETSEDDDDEEDDEDRPRKVSALSQHLEETLKGKVKISAEEDSDDESRPRHSALKGAISSRAVSRAASRNVSFHGRVAAANLASPSGAHHSGSLGDTSVPRAYNNGMGSQSLSAYTSRGHNSYAHSRKASNANSRSSSLGRSRFGSRANSIAGGGIDHDGGSSPLYRSARKNRSKSLSGGERVGFAVEEEKTFLRSIGKLVDRQSGRLSRQVSRRMSSVKNGNVVEGQGDEQGSVLLRDDQDGISIKLTKQIGKGGFGRVYLGQYGDRNVAIKAVFGEKRMGVRDEAEADDDDKREKMVQLEALLMSLISTGHPNVVHTYKCLSSSRDLVGPDQSNGLVNGPSGMIQYEWFIVMEHCAKGSLWGQLMSGTWHLVPDVVQIRKYRLRGETRSGSSPLSPNLQTSNARDSAVAAAAAKELDRHRALSRGGSRPGSSKGVLRGSSGKSRRPSRNTSRYNSFEDGGLGSNSNGTHNSSIKDSQYGTVRPAPDSTGDHFMMRSSLHTTVEPDLYGGEEGPYDPKVPDGSLVSWDAWACLEILKEVARAMQFLHENSIVHADLKAANVLLADANIDRRGYIAKVTDFGFARVISQMSHINTKTYGTSTHQSPELLGSGVMTTALDVYAFGILMWEVYCAHSVFEELRDSEVIIKVTRDGLRPTFPSGCPPAFKKLAETCWSVLPEDRPNMMQVEDELTELQLKLCPQGEHSPFLVVPGSAPARRR
ncbi:hypothetical protein CEUSTIGMA_g9386.t1 [Chlamydomonas eustigma]|uniref:Protein kinase domain-containing protein n=1 Tax=Chlamydomonas eustigma TaxID=1157962 RepID=A0A250XFV3_9CHLO|nr:hypothetical protein CEUSTIGMA_g9386.t1 [Chlamydomonas eustigma]|eukprot:GAX81958.1 hypothetical protein CEUSTIGMA_g9386.t1 [Chlamydomonas eustigma]